MIIDYSPAFTKTFRKLEASLQKEVLMKVDEFKDTSNHKRLNVQKLKGRVKDKYAFLVNYKIRIVFIKKTKDTICLMLEIIICINKKSRWLSR